MVQFFDFDWLLHERGGKRNLFPKFINILINPNEFLSAIILHFFSLGSGRKELFCQW